MCCLFVYLLVSLCRDGTARLWNCAEGKAIATLLKVESEINCCDIIDAEDAIEFPHVEEMAGKVREEEIQIMGDEFSKSGIGICMKGKPSFDI